MGSRSINRRHFLALSGAAGIGLGATLAGRLPTAAAQGFSGTSVSVLPSAAPSNWRAVLDKANAALQTEHGFTFDAQFINWTNYGQQALLKFTAGANFDTALQALWLNMAQLQQDNSLTDLTGQIEKWPNLKAQIAPKLIDANSWNGKLWGIPQVNSAARVQHFSIRQDLAEKHGFGEIKDYDTLERYFYAIKQDEPGIIPYGANASSGWLLAVPTPTGMFNQASWENPATMPYLLAGSGVRFIFARDAATTGSSSPIPFWEDDTVVAAFRKIRKYYEDGIINADALNTDTATIQSQFQAGRFASIWAMTDGTASNQMVGLQNGVPGATISQVMPFSKPLSQVRPVQTFQADNMVVVNANGGDIDRAMAMQDWLSVKANHDLIEYGIEGTDWEAVGEDGINQLSQYNFPGYGLLWRAGLERRSKFMTASEKTVFDWAQNYDNFDADTFASLVLNVTLVREAAAQMNNVIIQHANPLFYGVVDVDTQLSDLKSAAEAAGFDSIRIEVAKQADAYLKART